MGMITILEVEEKNGKELKEKMSMKAFSDVTGVVDFAHNVLNEFCVCF